MLVNESKALRPMGRTRMPRGQHRTCRPEGVQGKGLPLSSPHLTKETEAALGGGA